MAALKSHICKAFGGMVKSDQNRFSAAAMSWIDDIDQFLRRSAFASAVVLDSRIPSFGILVHKKKKGLR